MAKTPIEACNGIDPLVRVLKKRASGRGLNIVTKSRTHEEHLVIVAPATVAWCLNDAGIAKGDGETIRILIINAKMLDYMDGGQWYRFTPGMINSRAGIEVVANALDTTNQRASVVKKALKRTMKISTDLVEGTVADALGRHAAGGFDLAICFGEVLGNHSKALGNPGIKGLLDEGVPVYLADYSETVGQLNRFTLEVFGIDSELCTNTNPYELVSRVKGERWAGTITRLTAVTDMERVPDEEEFSGLTVTAQMVLHSHANGFSSYDPMIGRPLPAPHNSITCFLDSLGIDSNWTIYDLQRGVTPIRKLPKKWREYITPYPAGDSESERLYWAAHMKMYWLAKNDDEKQVA